MTVVADSSPLIFLGKIRRLALIHRLLAGEILVPEAVRDEVLAPPLDPAEAGDLEEFLATCSVETVRSPVRFALAMSPADNAAVTLAVRRKADALVCDDRIVRQVAVSEGMRPLGTLGILLGAMRQGFATQIETRGLVDSLIRSHGFRIGIELYQAVLREIDRR